MQFQFFSSFKVSLRCSGDKKRNLLRHQSSSARKYHPYKRAFLLAWEWCNDSGPLKPVTLEGRRERNGKDRARTGKGKGMHGEGSMQSMRMPCHSSEDAAPGQPSQCVDLAQPVFW